MADDDKKKATRKVAITNNDVGPRYANTLRGQEVVGVGQTLETECNGFQLDALDDEYVTGTDDAPRWTVETVKGDLQAASDQGKALKDLPVAKLRAIAEAEAVPLTGRKSEDGVSDLPDLKSAADIAAAIQAKRDANPA